MNYTLANTGGGGITQLKYAEINLSNADFTKLNTSPILVLSTTTGNTLIPVSTTVNYSCSSSSGFPLLMGFESLLTSFLTACWYVSPLSSGKRILSAQYDEFTTGGAGLNNIIANEDIVLKQNTDDNNLYFAYFYIYILYIEITII